MVVEKLSLIPKGLGIINKWLVVLVKFAMAGNLAVMVCIVFYAVLSRNLINSSIAWAEESSRILFIWLVFSGAILGLYYEEHLGLNILTDRMKPRVQTIFEMISWTLVIVVNRAMIIGGHSIVNVVKTARTPALGLPSSIKYLPVLVAGYIMILIALEHLIKCTMKLYDQHKQTKQGGNA